MLAYHGDFSPGLCESIKSPIYRTAIISWMIIRYMDVCNMKSNAGIHEDSIIMGSFLRVGIAGLP